MRGCTGSAEKVKRKSSGGMFSSSVCAALFLLPGLAWQRRHNEGGDRIGSKSEEEELWRHVFIICLRCLVFDTWASLAEAPQ